MALLYSLLVTGPALGAAALLTDSPAWLELTVILQGVGFLFVCIASDLLSRVTHVPRLEQAAALLDLLPTATDIPIERRPEHARDKVKNVFGGGWDGREVAALRV